MVGQRALDGAEGHRGDRGPWRRQKAVGVTECRRGGKGS
jgi:hypothetical protein